MAYPPNGSLLNFPFTQNGVPVFASQDASGTTVIPVANYTNHNGLWLPHQTDTNGYPIQAAQGTAPQGSGTTGTIASTNTAASFTIPMGSLTFGAGLFDAKQATIRLYNNGTGQTITQVQLQLSDTVGGVAIPVTYTQSASIASGATGVVVVPLTQGIGSQASVVVTFGTAPTAGSISVGVDWQSSGSANVGLAGSLVLYNGSITLSTTAQQLPVQAGSSVLLQSASANTDTILFGNATTQSMELAPGSSATITVSNLNLLYVVAAAGTPTVNWMVLS